MVVAVEQSKHFDVQDSKTCGLLKMGAQNAEPRSHTRARK